MRIVIIDNYDSFTYNLYQQVLAVAELPEGDVEVIRNDASTADALLAGEPSAIILSPGPGGPADAGICGELVARSAGRIPILGVCLGHQVIAAEFGGRIVRSPRPMHGYASKLFHSQRGIFEGVPHPTEVGRYHSLMVDPALLPACLEVEARTDDGVIMALSHRKFPLWGVQFHPESFLSRGTDRLMANFIREARRIAAAPGAEAAVGFL